MNGNIIVVIHNDTLLNAGTADMLVTFQTLCAGIGTHEGGIFQGKTGGCMESIVRSCVNFNLYIIIRSN